MGAEFVSTVDFSLPMAFKQINKQTVTQWQSFRLVSSQRGPGVNIRTFIFVLSVCQVSCFIKKYTIRWKIHHYLLH